MINLTLQHIDCYTKPYNTSSDMPTNEYFSSAIFYQSPGTKLPIFFFNTYIDDTSVQATSQDANTQLV